MSEWKNLHFRPPILKIKWRDMRISQLILMRVRTNQSKPLIGCFLLSPKEPCGFVFTALGEKQQLHLFGIEEQIEWMEVPE